MRRFTIIVAAAVGLLVLASSAKAQTGTLSDRMLISSPNGAPIFDQSLQDTPNTVQPALSFVGGPVPFPVPAGFPGVIVTLPGTKVVLLTEANPDPGEPPLVYTQPGTGLQVNVSDAIISTVVNPGTLPPMIMLLSEPNPDLTQAITNLANAPVPPTLLPETGALQDVTALLGSSFPGLPVPIDIQVQSDVPEPMSLSLLGLGVSGLLARRRRTRI